MAIPVRRTLKLVAVRLIPPGNRQKPVGMKQIESICWAIRLNRTGELLFDLFFHVWRPTDALEDRTTVIINAPTCRRTVVYAVGKVRPQWFAMIKPQQISLIVMKTLTQNNPCFQWAGRQSDQELL